MTPTPVPPQPQPYSLPLLAFLLSLAALCFFPLAPVALVLGIVALVRTLKDPRLAGKGLAIAATVIPVAGLPVMVFFAGVEAAVIIPNYIRHQARAKQAECQTQLKALSAAQQAHFAAKRAYATTFTALGFTAEQGNRYSSFLSEREVFPVDARWPLESAAAHGQALSERHLQPGASGEHLLMACVGNVDQDATLDVWTVDETGAVVHAADDVSD